MPRRRGPGRPDGGQRVAGGAEADVEEDQRGAGLEEPLHPGATGPRRAAPTRPPRRSPGASPRPPGRRAPMARRSRWPRSRSGRPDRRGGARDGGGTVRRPGSAAAGVVLVPVDGGHGLAHEATVPPGLDGGAGGAHQLEVVVQVVDGEEARTERLLALEEVMQVAAAVALAGGAAAGRVERRVGELVLGAGEPHPAASGEGGALPGQRGGDDAVEHVDAVAMPSSRSGGVPTPIR